MKLKLSKGNWRKYTFEFLSIFIAVISAFGLNNWNDRRNSRHSEQKILHEIRNSLAIDLKDFNTNMFGNRLSLKANERFKDLIRGQEIAQDSIGLFYTILFRDYIPIINRSAYESYKANNIKIITNDSLRLQIISLYDYYYAVIEALEYEVPEMQSYANYFSEINAILSPYMEFSEDGTLVSISSPDNLSEPEKKKILSYLWRIKSNRDFKLGRYETIIQEMKKVEESISSELAES